VEFGVQRGLLQWSSIEPHSAKTGFPHLVSCDDNDIGLWEILLLGEFQG
jgi:hypothetical protein